MSVAVTQQNLSVNVVTELTVVIELEENDIPLAVFV